MEKKGVTSIEKELQADIERLDYLNEVMNGFRSKRLEEKYPDRGSYRDVDTDDILENLGRNTVQFTLAAAEMGHLHPAIETDKEIKLLEQGADIISLVLMVIDQKAGI